MYLSVRCILHNFYKKYLRVDSELCRFLGPKQPICPEQNIFWYKPLFLLSSTYGLFIVQNLKEILQWIQNYGDAPFSGPKWFIYLKYIFFQETC